MNATATNDLCATLNTKPVREFLLPLVKQLGGLPAETCRRYHAGVKHYSSMARDAMVSAILATYEVAAIESAMQVVSAPKINDSELLATLVRKIAAGGVDAEQVRSILAEERSGIIAEAIEAAKSNMVRTIEVTQPGMPTINVGVQHKNFEYLLKMAACRLGNGRRMNVWLHGPAGTGKTSAARKVAEALSLNFYYTGAIETAYALFGYTDAHGKLVRTTFRDAWEHGGIFLLDEVDASNPQALAALNAAIDGSVAAFPDRMIERHSDCIILAGANTVGRGGDTKYAGRVRQDEAFLSRWALLEWPLDEQLEAHLAGNDDAAKTMLRIVRDLRQNAAARKIDGASLTTRAVLDGAAMLRGGLPIEIVLGATVRKGMPADAWTRLTEGVRLA